MRRRVVFQRFCNAEKPKISRRSTRSSTVAGSSDTLDWVPIIEAVEKGYIAASFRPILRKPKALRAWRISDACLFNCETNHFPCIWLIKYAKEIWLTICFSYIVFCPLLLHQVRSIIIFCSAFKFNYLLQFLSLKSVNLIKTIIALYLLILVKLWPLIACPRSHPSQLEFAYIKQVSSMS